MELTEEQIAALRATFDKFDINHDGTISAAELGAVLEEIKVDDQSLPAEMSEAVLKEADLDANGVIDFGEFVAMISQKFKELDTETELLRAFQILDKDGNGFITRDEIDYFVKDMPVEADIMNEMLNSLDLDGDGRISFIEFVKWMLYF